MSFRNEQWQQDAQTKQVELDKPEAILKPEAESCKHCELAVNYGQNKKEQYHSDINSVKQNVSNQNITFSLACIPATVVWMHHKEPSEGR